MSATARACEWVGNKKAGLMFGLVACVSGSLDAELKVTPYQVVDLRASRIYIWDWFMSLRAVEKRKKEILPLFAGEKRQKQELILHGFVRLLWKKCYPEMLSFHQEERAQLVLQL